MSSVAELLQEKYSRYQELKKNMEVLKRTIQCGDDSQFVRLNEERETILKAVDLLDGELARLKFTPPGIPEMDRPGPQPIKNWVRKLQEAWQEIFTLNRECLLKAESRCRDLKSEMATMGREVQTVIKYRAPQPGGPPRFIDLVQ